MLFDFLELNKGEKAVYKMLYEGIKQAISDGVFKPGERLPSIRQAAAELRLSRTTVENAYVKLCVEGYVISRPQKGYFIAERSVVGKIVSASKPEIDRILYDLSSQGVDISSADVMLWQKKVRGVLQQTQQLISYGDPQGEYELRLELAKYCFTARGVKATPDNIVIGAGVGPLLSLLSGLVDAKKIGIEGSGFSQARQIFLDHGLEVCEIESDRDGVLPQNLMRAHVDILLELPSSRPKISVSGIALRREKIIEWVKLKDNRYIVEDDYNGELRYNARVVPAFQGLETDKIIYLGSFSKLLLPSVRIAYMVLPNNICSVYYSIKKYYNQTVGKTEQLALAEYIRCGALERHLRRLRKLYAQKSKLLIDCISHKMCGVKSITLLETSLALHVEVVTELNQQVFFDRAVAVGIRMAMPIKTHEGLLIKISFSSIIKEKIDEAVEQLNKVLTC